MMTATQITIALAEMTKQQREMVEYHMNTLGFDLDRANLRDAFLFNDDKMVYIAIDNNGKIRVL